MSTSYETIDPRIHIMVDKTSDQTTLLNENHNLKHLNLIIVIISIATISIGLISYRNLMTRKEQNITSES